MIRMITKQKGVTQIEFSIIALAVILVLFLIMEFALYFFSVQMVNEARIQVRSATLPHLSSHAHFFEYHGWLFKAYTLLWPVIYSRHGEGYYILTNFT